MMTIGQLSQRTGVAVKTLRQYEDLGLVYTAGRSPGNYRLFDDEALWCVTVITGLRELGLTLNELHDLAGSYLGRPDQPVGPRLAEMLTEVRARTAHRIAELHDRLQLLDEFEAAAAAELSGQADFRSADPRQGDCGA